MKSQPTIIYRDIPIRHIGENQFFADGEDYSTKPADLVTICDRIDKLLASTFTRTPVFWEGYRAVSTGIATSVTENGEVWISHPDKKGNWGSREKHAGPVYLDTPQNRELYGQIQAMRTELEEIVKGYQERANAVRAKMASIGGK